MSLIVADSGPLIVFARCQQLELLQQVVKEIVVPLTVYEECTRETHKPGAQSLITARQINLIIVRSNAETPAELKIAPLDKGEMSALALALEMKCPVLMDERIGRMVAKQNSIAVIGSLGVLLKAKQMGLIEQIRPILDAWQKNGYFISAALKTEALQLAQEA